MRTLKDCFDANREWAARMRERERDPGFFDRLRDMYAMHRDELDAIGAEEKRADRLCELNVAAQVANVCRTTIVQDAWRQGRPLVVHGWIYSVSDGLLRDLDICVGERTRFRALTECPERCRAWLGAASKETSYFFLGSSAGLM